MSSSAVLCFVLFSARCPSPSPPTFPTPRRRHGRKVHTVYQPPGSSTIKPIDVTGGLHPCSPLHPTPPKRHLNPSKHPASTCLPGGNTPSPRMHTIDFIYRSFYPGVSPYASFIDKRQGKAKTIKSLSAVDSQAVQETSQNRPSPKRMDIQTDISQREPRETNSYLALQNHCRAYTFFFPLI